MVTYFWFGAFFASVIDIPLSNSGSIYTFFILYLSAKPNWIAISVSVRGFWQYFSKCSKTSLRCLLHAVSYNNSPFSPRHSPWSSSLTPWLLLLDFSSTPWLLLLDFSSTPWLLLLDFLLLDFLLLDFLLLDFLLLDFFTPWLFTPWLFTPWLFVRKLRPCPTRQWC